MHMQGVRTVCSYISTNIARVIYKYHIGIATVSNVENLPPAASRHHTRALQIIFLSAVPSDHTQSCYMYVLLQLSMLELNVRRVRVVNFITQ